VTYVMVTHYWSSDIIRSSLNDTTVAKGSSNDIALCRIPPLISLRHIVSRRTTEGGS
jgi:hypothetical protein